MTELGNKIIELKKEGYSYNKIMKELNCSKSTISYYLGVRDFQTREGSKLFSTQEINFSINDFLLKIGNEPKCYLSGELINLHETKSYSIDHITPASKGGENTIENAGLISSSINKMKSDITVKEFLEN